MDSYVEFETKFTIVMNSICALRTEKLEELDFHSELSLVSSLLEEDNLSTSLALEIASEI